MTRTPAEIPTISATTLWLFRRIVRRYFRRQFRAVLAQNSSALRDATGPLVVYANHSSWWDPMLCVLLGELLLPSHKHYAPMDADALKRYPILRRIGIFPVEMNSPRGAARFLRTAEAVLADGGVLWVTPQGEFADARKPLTFKPGLGALATRVLGLQLMPLAIEYLFWDERLPETLLRFGKAVTPEAANAESTTAWLEDALRVAMAELAQAAMARDASAFEVLYEGQRGPGGVYAITRRVRALFSRGPVELDHTVRKSKAHTR